MYRKKKLYGSSFVGALISNTPAHFYVERFECVQYPNPALERFFFLYICCSVIMRRGFRLLIIETSSDD